MRVMVTRYMLVSSVDEMQKYVQEIKELRSFLDSHPQVSKNILFAMDTDTTTCDSKGNNSDDK